MLKYLNLIFRFIDTVNEKLGVFISWLTTLLVLVVCYDVITRYLLKVSSVAVQELEWHLFSVIFLVAGAYTLKHNRHVRVDALYQNLSSSKKHWINFFGYLLFLIPFCVMVIWASLNFVGNSYEIGETSPDPGGLPFRFVLKASIPIGFLLILLQGLSLAFRSLLAALGSEKAKLLSENE